MASLAALTARLNRLEREAAQRADGPHAERYRAYRHDPTGFAADCLGVRLTPDQSDVLRSLLDLPHRVLVKSGHNIGKTFLAAVAVIWWYCTRDPGVVITTAPTERDVVDLLWTEIRLLAGRVGLTNHFVGSAAPEMRSGPEHYAKGYTARKGESFQGRHRPNMLFVFDEAEGVDAAYWRTANTMFQPDGTNAWLAILNPTTTTSQSYQEERMTDSDGRRKWRVYSLSSLNHPNITAQLRGRSAPVPNAVTLAQVQSWLGDWFEELHSATSADPSRDVEFPPGSGRWWRPSPEGESRVLGRRPSAGTYGVWSEALWQAACHPHPPLAWRAEVDAPEIGADIARYGDDRTEIHVRCGPCSLYHEDAGGWDTVRTADRLMALAGEYADWANRQRHPSTEPVSPTAVLIKVDDTGVGGGVTDILRAHGYAVVPVNAGAAAPDRDRYPRVRDQLWFETVARARRGELDLSRLPLKTLSRLEVQALAPTWQPLPDRRRQVEPKEHTKKRIGRSPDGMDALNLAYYSVGGGVGAAEWLAPPDRRNWRSRHAA